MPMEVLGKKSIRHELATSGTGATLQLIKRTNNLSTANYIKLFRSPVLHIMTCGC